MKKNEWSPAYERLRPFFEDAAQTYFDGDVEKGFKFWAVKQILMDMGLSDDALKDPLELDGRGDLSLDGYYEDEENENLIVIQSKFHDRPASVGNEDLNRFFQCLTKVLNPDVVVASRNPLAQDAHRAVRDAIERGWTLRFVFVTSGYLSPEGKTFADTTKSQTEVIDSAMIRKELEAYDLGALQQLYDSHLSPTRLNTDVTISLAGTDYYEGIVSKFRVCVAAIPAAELVNSNIRRTLEDNNSRQWFFHLNNGITALCDGFKVVDGQLTIRDFQIVNGCQTTVTLIKVAPVVEADSSIRFFSGSWKGCTG